MKLKFIIPLIALLGIIACTPKPPQTPEPPVVETAPPPPPKDDLSPCKNWLSLPEADRKRAQIQHSLYRDVMKNIRGANELANVDKADFDRAFENWQAVFEVAPAADGERNTHYGDGIKMYEYKAYIEKDSMIRDGYIKKMLFLYDEVIKCYGREGFTLGRKAFDLFYKYPEYATNDEKFNTFKRSFDLEGDDAPAFIINPFTSLLTGMVLDEKIDMAEASSYAAKILNLIEKNKEEYTEAKWKSEGWDVVASFAPERLKTLEGVQGFYDCDYFKNQYYQAYENAPNDCDSIILVLSRLKWAQCSGDDPQVDKVFQAFRENCVGPDTLGCRYLISEGRYKEAVDCYLEKAKNATDDEARAKYYLFVAKIYYGELKKYSLSRKYALEAAKYKSNWGEPYILIGKLYASSGPLCGSGRGWNSQVVTWPAIDKWQKAKSIDPSVAAEANKLIAKYRRFMPSVEDIFQRGLKEGDSFKVLCWIQERTIIRAAK